uniref:diacylglycerol O-acyltransferase n=1 Tax=Megaselia scalaris TaxID=36166 RepID=T1GR76_MEGSC
MWCRKDIRENKHNRQRQRRPSISIAQLQNTSDPNGTNNTKKLEDNEVILVQYPENLNYKDIMYFMFAPTLCYELNFAKTTRIRKHFLLKRFLEVIVGINVMMALFQQWIIPSVKNSLVPFSNMEVTLVVERLLKLAVPNHLLWLCFFYLTFHSLMNLTGELLHFADRNFYCDWWNANNIDTFWRTWNMPVHRWCVRHLYIPLVNKGYSQKQASMVVFLFSAFFHDGMMAQLPLSSVSKFFQKNVGPRWGNIVVWASIILGQPLCIMMYYHDYVITHFRDTLITS